MAKKIAKKIKLVKAKKEVKPVRQVKKSKAPFVLNIIAVCLLLINGLTMIFGREWMANMIVKYGNFNMGIEVLSSNFLTLGIIWLILGILIWVGTVRVQKGASRIEKWYLFALAIITLLSGRGESGILTLIGSIMYLKRK